MEDEKSFMVDTTGNGEETEEFTPAAVILLSDQPLLDEDEEDEEDVYMMEYSADMDSEEYEYELMNESATAAAVNGNDDQDCSFYLEEEDDDSGDMDNDGLVIENPFEPVYPATSAGLLFASSSDEQQQQQNSGTGEGMILEAISLDNILPPGSRRRRN